MIAYPCCGEVLYPCCPDTSRPNSDPYCAGPANFYIPSVITIESQVSCECGEGGSLEPCNGFFEMNCIGYGSTGNNSYYWMYYDIWMAECLCPNGLGAFKLEYIYIQATGEVMLLGGLYGFWPAGIGAFLTCSRLYPNVASMGTDFFLNLSDHLFDDNCYKAYEESCDCPTFYLTTGSIA